MLSHREWFFRLSYLSLSLLINFLPARGADIPGGIASWVIRQSVQVIAGVMGVKTSDYLLKGNGLSSHADAHYKIDTMIQETKHANNAQSAKVDIDSTHQGGKGTTAKAKQQSGTQYEQYVLDEWHKQEVQYSDKQIDDQIKQNEEIINNAKADRVYYKQGTKARAEVEDHINFYEQNLAQLKEIKESRHKEQLSKQVTTLGATTAVLTNKTAGTSAPQALEKATEEPSNKNDEKKDKKQQLPAPKDPPPHKSGQELEFYEKDNPGKYGHQWRDEGGHFKEDTPTARELIRRTVKEGNYRGVKNGKYQYDWIDPKTGEQIWVETIGTKIHNHGINLKPWEVNKATGFIEAPDGYQRAPTGVIRCEATGAIIWPLVPALMDKLEREAEKPNPLPDTEVRKLADAAINNYLKENPISGIVIKMPTYAIPVPPKEAVDHPTPGAHKTDGFIVPYKPTMLETTPTDYNDIHQWWPFTNHHLPSDFPEAPEAWASPSKVARYEKAVEMYKNKGGFGSYSKGYDYGNTDHIWKKGDPAPDWAKPGWAKGIK